MIIDWKWQIQGISSNRVPEELWMEIHNIVQEAVIKTIPKKRKCNKTKWLSEETKSYPTLCDSHGLQHARLPCLSPSPGVCSNSHPWVNGAIQPSHPLLFPSPPAFTFPSIRVFFNEWALHIRWPKYWSFSFSISPSNDNSGLISHRIHWVDLFAVQGALKSLL